MTKPESAASLVEALIRSYRFRFSCEKDLQAGLEKLLSGSFEYEREVSLGEHGTIDFMIEPGLGLEVKTDGSLSQVTRQLHRYAQNEKVKALMLVTSRSQHDRMPAEMNGKQVYVVPLIGSAF